MLRITISRITGKAGTCFFVRNITGFFGHRMEVNRNAYLKHFPIDKYVDFVVNRQHSAWDWTQAEQHGKWIESAYLSAVQGDDKEF